MEGGFLFLSPQPSPAMHTAVCTKTKHPSLAIHIRPGFLYAENRGVKLFSLNTAVGEMVRVARLELTAS